MLTSANHAIALAAKHRRSALVLSLGVFAAMFAFLLAGAVTNIPRPFFSRGFALLFAMAILAWGVVLLGSWFAKPVAVHGGVQRFVDRAWRGFAALFLIIWFCLGLALVVWALIA